MGALTLRLADHRYLRLRVLAKSRRTTINRLFDEMTMLKLADFDSETRFKLYASQGNGQSERGLQLLNKAATHRAVTSFPIEFVSDTSFDVPERFMQTTNSQQWAKSQTQQQGAVNALYDSADAAEFLSRFNLESLDRTLSNLIQTKGLSGNALFEAAGKKLADIDVNIRFPDQSGGCFIKGTRVHTREGLKRIEEIQVGDYVLSSPEDGSGMPEYRQVVNTFKHEKKRVFKVGFREPVHNSKTVVVNATGNHPFWVEGLGWTRADELKNDQVLRTADGSRRVVDLVQPIYRTKLEGIGWFAALRPVEEGAWGGCFDYANGTVFEDPNDELMYIDPEILNSDNPFLEVTVYNLEVEGHHTYYVSSVGIWVHNTDCTNVRPFNDVIGVVPPADTPFFTQASVFEKRIAEGIAQGQAPSGLAVVRSAQSGLKEKFREEFEKLCVLITKETEEKYLQRWLKFEDAVVGRIVDDAGVRSQSADKFPRPSGSILDQAMRDERGSSHGTMAACYRLLH